MVWWILLILVVLAILWFSPVRITLIIRVVGVETRLHLQVHYLFLRWYDRRDKLQEFTPLPTRDVTPQATPPSGQTDADGIFTRIQDGYARVVTWKQKLDDVQPTLRKVARAFDVHSFVWRSSVGVADAADTAVICGLCWCVKGVALAIIHDWFVLQNNPVIEVVPRFQRPGLTSELHCIVSGGFGKAIYAGLRILRLLRVEDAHAGTSDSVAHADGDGEPQRDGGRQYDYRRSS